MTEIKGNTNTAPGAVVRSVAKYLDYVQAACSNFANPLFRGHCEESWSLSPKIARLTLRDDAELLSAEQSMLTEFQRRALPHLEYQPRTKWDWLALAQHFGMPTRLLDWTTNPLAALWFAIENPASSNSRAAVWIFHAFPSEYVTDPDAESPFSTNFTMVFRPNHLTRRIVAQDGWFTVHKYIRKSKRFIPLERNTRYKQRLSYVAIPPDAFASLRAELDRCGVNAAALYADLPSLSRYIAWKFSPLPDEDNMPARDDAEQAHAPDRQQPASPPVGGR